MCIRDSVMAGNTVNISAQATDNAGDAVTLTAQNLPEFISFSAGANGTGLLTIAPGMSDLGMYDNITVTATDNHGATSIKPVKITVTDNAVRSFYVNIAGESGNREPSPWNNLVSYPFAGSNLSNLTDDRGTSTSYGFRLVNSWTGSWQGGMLTGNNSGIVSDNILKTSVYNGSAETKTLQFTGLDVTKVYNIAEVSSNNAGFDATFTLTSGSKTLQVNGRYNSNSKAQLNGLVPSSSGVLEFTITKAAGAKFAFFNAVVLEEYTATSPLIRPIDLLSDINEPGLVKMVWSDRSNSETGYEIWLSLIHI